MRRHAWLVGYWFLLCGGSCANAGATPAPQAPERIIIDTDIGDAIDDPFAIALALRSPELDVLGISTDYGDTEGRARILDRMLGEDGRQSIPVAVGAATAPVASNDSYTIAHALDQRRYGDGGHFARTSHPHAVGFILDQVRRFPGEITLVTIGPLPNIGALIDTSPETFRKLKRVVMMGGSIAPRKPEYGAGPPAAPVAEWNVRLDIGAAQKLFRSGVPVYVMPMDSTEHLQLDEIKRTVLFARGTPLTDALTLLYHQWSAAGGVTPTLYDVMTIAYILDPRLCPVQPMHIRVDDQGFTRVEDGAPNAQVCLHSDADAVLRFYMQRLLAPETGRD
jgi:inosine-uridine nucleoside N-ribohydrolase